MHAAKLTSKGQITIPKAVRQRLGVRAGDVLEFVSSGPSYRLRKRAASSRVDRWVGCLAELEGEGVDGIVEGMRGR